MALLPKKNILPFPEAYPVMRHISRQSLWKPHSWPKSKFEAPVKGVSIVSSFLGAYHALDMIRLIWGHALDWAIFIGKPKAQFGVMLGAYPKNKFNE
jgi:hypothetical protein